MLIGVLTTAIFVFVAVALWSAELYLPAGVLGAMAAYRGFFVGRALWWWITPDDPEDDEVSGS